MPFSNAKTGRKRVMFRETRGICLTKWPMAMLIVLLMPPGSSVSPATGEKRKPPGQTKDGRICSAGVPPAPYDPGAKPGWGSRPGWMSTGSVVVKEFGARMHTAGIEGTRTYWPDSGDWSSRGVVGNDVLRSRHSSMALEVLYGTCRRRAFDKAKLSGGRSVSAISRGLPPNISS